MSLSANSWDAAGQAGAAADVGMVADTVLGLVVVHLDPDRLACPNAHHILALGLVSDYRCPRLLTQIEHKRAG